ncbi:MAG: hypothetical protein DBX39_02505 [Bacillota bacterium]|nr:MAG: hypothetical protein DBX39_02505 [Bacillota bacterium]
MPAPQFCGAGFAIYNILKRNLPLPIQNFVKSLVLSRKNSQKNKKCRKIRARGEIWGNRICL